MGQDSRGEASDPKLRRRDRCGNQEGHSLKVGREEMCEEGERFGRRREGGEQRTVICKGQEWE